MGYSEICEEIKRKVSLSQEMEEHHIFLIRKSNGDKMCCCPFHDDSTPSMLVNSAPDNEVETYKCFGCQEKGSVIDFVMKMRGYSFLETIQYFKEKYAITTNIADIDVVALMDSTKSRKKQIAVNSLMMRVSRVIRDFIKTSENKKQDILILKPSIRELDKAAFLENIEVLMGSKKKILKAIEEIKEYRKRKKANG